MAPKVRSFANHRSGWFILCATFSGRSRDGDGTLNKHRFAVLDRDGTIIVDHPYSADSDRIKFLPGAERGLRMLRDSGIGLVVVTNQSGIGRGLFDEAALAEIVRSVMATEATAASSSGQFDS